VKQSVIYAIRNKINGKSYMGSTNDLYCRRALHLSRLRKKRHHSIILQRAFDKYGEDAFEFFVLESVEDPTQLLIREQIYLDTFRPVYNVSKKSDRPPSQKGKKFTETHKANLSKALKGRVSPMKGKKFTEEHRLKISKANKGNKSNIGHHHTEKSKDLMRLHHNKKSHPPRSAQQRLALSLCLKKWHASLTEEQRQERAKKLGERGRDLKTLCIICGKSIVYRSKGKRWIPQTCSPECLFQLRRNLLNERRKKDPGMDLRAALAPRKGIRVHTIVVSECVVCHKKFEGKKKTCGPACLSLLRAGRPKPFSATLEITSNEKVKLLCEYVSTHGHTPSHRSRDENERSLGGFLGSKRQAKTGKGTSTLYESDIKIAESLGYPDIFNLNNPEKTSNRMCRKICEWIKTHGGNMPKARSADSEESSLSEWIHYRKKCLRGITGSGEFYQSDMTIAESYGYHFFDQLKYKSSEE